MIQVGAFSKRENALNLETKLRAFGYVVRIEEKSGKQRTLAKLLEQRLDLTCQVVKR